MKHFQNEICVIYIIVFLYETATKPWKHSEKLWDDINLISTLQNISVSVFLKLQVLVFSMKEYRERKNNSLRSEYL